MKYGSMIKVISGVGAMLGLLTSANAQQATTYNWNGVYAGVHAGKASGDTANDASLSGQYCPILACAFLGGDPTPYSFSGSQDGNFSGMVGGVAVGYNYQWGRLVLGAEADLNASEASSAPVSIFSANPFGLLPIEVGSFTTELDWYGTLRGRLGYDIAGGFMVYGTGGLAYGHVSNSIGYSVGSFSESSSSSGMRTGWTAGAGAEMALFKSDRLRLKAEYLYTDFGSDNFFRTDLPDAIFFNDNVANANSALKFHTVRVGINYAF